MTKEMPRVMCSAGQEERCYCRSRKLKEKAAAAYGVRIFLFGDLYQAAVRH